MNSNLKSLFFKVTALSVTTLILFYIIYLILNDLNISIQTISSLHSSMPVLWVIDFTLFIVVPLGMIFISYRFTNIFKKYDLELEESKRIIEENVEFTKHLINNNLEYTIQDDKKNVLGKSLVQLRDRLKQNKKEELTRKKEDEQRSWATEGQAKFAEILRENNSNLKDLSYNVINKLVKYLGANQGGMFLLNDEGDDTYFELMGCYAYDLERKRQKTIKWGEGLVGRCAIEKLPIYMNDIPQKYVNITSGLGEATPTSLFLVPMLINDELQGVLEIASFKEIETYQKEFIEKIAEIVASTISGVKINMQTSKLLEESREQGNKLAKQEEEMRKNMDEMKMFQKEAAKQSEEFISFSNSVNHTMIRADYNIEGTLLYANTKFLKMLGYNSNSDVEGKSIHTFINDKDKTWFNNIWNNLAKGGKHYEGFMKHMTKDGQDLWTLSTYTCVRDDEGKVTKVLFLAIDTTENKKQSIEFEGMIRALDRSSLKAEFEIGGEILNCNTNFMNSLSYTMDTLKEKTIFDLIDISESKNMRKNWSKVIKNITHDGRVKFLCKDSREKYFYGTYSAVRDMYGDIYKIVFIGNDITEQVHFERKVELQNEQLLKQETMLQENQQQLELKLRAATQNIEKQLLEVEKNKILYDKTLEGALDAIFTIDKIGRILFFNNAAELLWGFNKEEVINKNVEMLFSKDTAEENDFIKSLIDRNAEKIIGVRQEISILDKNRNEKPVLALLSAAEYDKERRITAFIQNVEVELF